MATIDVRRSHQLTKDAARTKAEELARDMQQKLGLDWRWEGDQIKFQAPGGAAKGTTGVVDVNDREVRVQIDLPFLLRAMKGTIETKVREKLERALG